MSWQIVTRKLGRAGGLKERTARQREWDREHGEGMWAIGYVIDDRFILQEEAIDLIYHKSYEEHFRNHPEDLEELINLAKELHNPHAKATTGVDLQVPAITEYLAKHNLKLQGIERVDIGSWNGEASHPISIRLSPLQIKVIGNPKMTLEQFWQNKKCLAVWIEDD
jgi:hypothetical protein